MVAVTELSGEDVVATVVVVLDGDVSVAAVVELLLSNVLFRLRYGAARAGFPERNAAERSPDEHPPAQAFVEQQPQNGGLLVEQV